MVHKRKEKCLGYNNLQIQQFVHFISNYILNNDYKKSNLIFLEIHAPVIFSMSKIS